MDLALDETATLEGVLEGIILSLDCAMGDLQALHMQGDYVKYSYVADILLDFRLAISSYMSCNDTILLPSL